MPDHPSRPKMMPARAALMGVLARYPEAGEGATPLEVQKLLYFLQAAGERLGLEFAKQRYGPYADAVRHMVERLEGHYLVGYGDGTAHRAVRLLPGATDEAGAVLAGQPEARERFERVTSLIERFETPYGLELLATTHWVATKEGAPTADAATRRVQEWSPRKERLFTHAHVSVAWERLLTEGWLGTPAQLFVI